MWLLQVLLDKLSFVVTDYSVRTAPIQADRTADHCLAVPCSGSVYLWVYGVLCFTGWWQLEACDGGVPCA